MYDGLQICAVHQHRGLHGSAVHRTWTGGMVCSCTQSMMHVDCRGMQSICTGLQSNAVHEIWTACMDCVPMCVAGARVTAESASGHGSASPMRGGDAAEGRELERCRQQPWPIRHAVYSRAAARTAGGEQGAAADGGRSATPTCSFQRCAPPSRAVTAVGSGGQTCTGTGAR